MKKILLSLMTLVLVVGMVGGGAFAYFSNTETSTGNTFTTGTLDIGPGSDFVRGETGYYPPNTHCTMAVTPGGNGANGKVVFTNLSPGDSGSIFWEVKNVGTLNGSLDMELTRTADDDNGITEPEDAADGTPGNGSDGSADGDLDDYMHIRIQADLDNDGTFETILKDGLGMGELEDYVEDTLYPEVLADHALNAGDTIKVQFAWRIDPEIAGVDDNIIQGDGVQLDIKFELLQSDQAD